MHGTEYVQTINVNYYQHVSCANPLPLKPYKHLRLKHPSKSRPTILCLPNLSCSHVVPTILEQTYLPFSPNIICSTF